MSRYIHYAMEEESLQAYLDHKNMISEQSVNLSATEIDRIKLELNEFKKNDRVLFSSEGDTAFMTISGVLEPKPDMCAIMFGFDMTTYQDIIESIHEIEKDEAITNLDIEFDTPGGNVTGLFAACDVIRNTRLHVTGIVTGMAASAGFALISQCDTIKGVNQSIEVGSIGVRTDMVDRSEQDKRNGVVKHTLVSSNAPNKVADISTKDGRQNVIDRLTKLEGVFINYVALGRNTTTENVKKSFGQGGMLIANDALDIGMIDDIISVLPEARNTTSSDNTNTEINTQGDNDTMEMTAEEIAKIASDAATQAANTVKLEMTAEIDKREMSAKAENDRKSGFTTLLAAYPEQATMINEEMAKENAIASADFTVKVAQSEASRIAAAGTQLENSDDLPPAGGQPAGSDTEDLTATNDVNALAGQLGVDITEAN